MALNETRLDDNFADQEVKTTDYDFEIGLWQPGLVG